MYLERMLFLKSIRFLLIIIILLNIGCTPEPTLVISQSKASIAKLSQLAPIIGTNNISLPPSSKSEIRSLNVTDQDTPESGLRVFFEGDKLKNKITIKNINGISAEIKCGGEKGDINPLQCQFTLLSPALINSTELFVIDFQVRDITLTSSGNDVGKSSETGKMFVTFNRDLIAIDAKDTRCSFVINQQSASCDIQGLAINESRSEDIKITLTNATKNAGEVISCEKKFVGQDLNITCSINLANALATYPTQKDFVAIFNITNSVSPSLSMKTSKNITFSFARDTVFYTKKQTFITSSTAQIPGVDILWVVDNSGSMASSQKALATNFPAFIESFVPLKDGVRVTPYPFKMSAITSDAYARKVTSTSTLCPFVNCSANGNPIVVNDSLAKENFELFKSNFDTIIQVGTAGSSSERSIESMNKFLDLNPSWSNANNLLVVIFMSDELEQSYKSTNCPLPASLKSSPASDPFTFTPECTAKRVQWSKDQILKLKARKELIKIHSIVSFSQDIGKVYQEISKEFLGTYQSLSSSFSTLLSQIGTSITDTFLEYNLIFQGKIKKIKMVKLDGVELPNSYNENYEFIAPNKIKLKTNPGEGKILEVEFEYSNEII
jgi:hypothetical protein